MATTVQVKTTAQVKRHLDADLGILELSLALQWGLATGEIRSAGDASASSRSRIIAAFRRQATAAVQAAKTQIKTLICDDLDYCKNKDKKAVRAAVLLVDAKVIALTGIALPMGSFAAYIVKARYLDRICNCPEKPSLARNIAAARSKRTPRRA